MGDKELGAPVRVRLVFADHHLLPQELRSELRWQGFRGSWATIRPEFATVADFARDIINCFGLRCSSIHGLVLSMDGYSLPSFESTSLIRDNDIISVSQKIGKGKKKAVAIPDEERQIENKVIEKQTVLSNNCILLIENGENASQKKKSNKKKKKKRALTEVISTEREHKEMESPEESKKKKLKLAANEMPVTIEASCLTVNHETNVSVTASERNKKVNCTSQNTYSEHRGGQEEQKSMMLHNFKDKFMEMTKDSHGAIQGNGTGAGLSTGQENGRRTDKTTAGSSPWRPRSNLDGPNAPSPSNMQKSWIQSDGQKEKNSQVEISNSVSIDEEEESDDKDDIDFDSFYPLTCLPTEGDIIAYRLVETSGRPELSFFRVGKVIKFDPITMRILLGPVSQYPIFPDGEISESQKSLYKEDGTLEIDFGSLVDLRLVEESESGQGYGKSKVTTWENETGSHSAWKTTGTCNANEETKTNWGTWAPSTSRGASWRGRGQRGSRIQSCSGSRGRNGGIRKNVNSAWQAGGPSNANEATNYCQAPWGMNNSRYGTSNPRRGQNGNRFGARGSFSRGMNDRAGNNNNSAWEANTEATNANEPTQTQENGWDTWQPNPSRPGASWSYRGSGGGFSRGTRRGRGGRYSNPKFNK